jgi:hypothetical protein
MRFLCIAVAAGASSFALISAVADATASARGHRGNPSCAQILPAQKLDQALIGASGPAAGSFSGVRLASTKEWYYPYNRPEHQLGSDCFYVWPPNGVPADFQAAFGPPTGPTTGGGDIYVGFGLSTKSFKKGRAAAQSGGVGTPADFPPGHVHSLNLGHGVLAAYLEDVNPGAGATTDVLAAFVLTRHHNYFAVYVWDASFAQLKNVVNNVLAYKAGGF